MIFDMLENAHRYKTLTDFFDHHILVVFLFCSFLSTGLQAQTTGKSRTRIVLDRYRKLLLDCKPPEPESIRKLASGLKDDGTWPDINYKDKTQSRWRTMGHLSRLRRLAIAVKHPHSKVKEDTAIMNAIWRGLDHWLEKEYEQGNWWYTRIGIPRQMRAILILLNDEITPERRNRGWKIVARSGLPDMTGANQIWIANLTIAQAAAENDKRLLARAAALASAEIKISNAEGIQPDFSFHQHKARLQTFHYGMSYVRDLSDLAWILRETPWAFPKEKGRILIDYMVKGMDWMRRGTCTVPGTLDRAATRPGCLGNKRLTPPLKRLREAFPELAEKINPVIEREAGRGKPLIGFRHFPRSDFTAYHRKEFSFFVKTLSNRTLPSEQISNENLKNKHLYCSDSHFMRDGLEYYNMMPVWEWFWLPGITATSRMPAFEQRSFVGGMGNGQSGQVAIDYRFGKALTARKAWFCHNNRVICLIGGLRCPRPTAVHTALDQCRLDGAVTVGIENGQRNIDKKTTLKNVSWIHHRGVAYVLLNPSQISITMGKVTGSWKSISSGMPAKPVTDHVFLPLLFHGKNINNGSCAYMLAPADKPETAAALARNPGFKVLTNSRDIQAVLFDDGRLMAAFYTAGSLKEGERPVLKVNHQCLIMVQDNTLWMANPAHKACTVTVEISDQRPLQVSIPGDGTTVKVSAPGGKKDT